MLTEEKVRFKPCRLFTASLFTHAKEKVGGSGGFGALDFASGGSKTEEFILVFIPYPVRSSILDHVTLASISLAILSARLTIEYKYEKIEGYEQSINLVECEFNLFERQ